MTRQILTIITLLLSLCTYTVAQNRSAKENLEGLREIGVIVKYGNVDGLAAAMQPTVLQMLQDRAEDQLRHAEIPLVQSAAETDLVNRPRLVLTVTVNKPTATAPTIDVESRFYERVRLKRDSSTEMELATWAHGGVGIAQRVSNEMLFSVFDQQLNRFIKDYGEMNPIPRQAVSPTVPLTQIKDNASSLHGLNGTRLFVSFRHGSFGDAAQGDELQKRLQSEAEANLVKVGIPILKWTGETEREGDPLLKMVITLSKANSTRRPIELESQFWQRVRPVRDRQKEIYAVTWETEVSDSGSITDDAVRQVMNKQLDDFIKAYKAANPSVSTTSKAQ